MNRFFQVLLILSTLGFSWLAMMVVHEAGHSAHAWISGGRVSRVVLHPAGFSRTDLSYNPHTIFVAWGGPIGGCLIPLALLIAVRFFAPSHAYLAVFFTGFCFVANGAYLVGGSFLATGDAGDLLRHGTPRWQLLAFGVPAAAAGLYLWNGLGPKFGLGRSAETVDRKAAIGVTVALVLLVVSELALTG